jgi:hypothetical protein
MTAPGKLVDHFKRKQVKKLGSNKKLCVAESLSVIDSFLYIQSLGSKFFEAS